MLVSTKLHGVTPNKTAIVTVTASRTSNLAPRYVLLPTCSVSLSVPNILLSTPTLNIPSVSQTVSKANSKIVTSSVLLSLHDNSCIKRSSIQAPAILHRLELEFAVMVENHGQLGTNLWPSCYSLHGRPNSNISGIVVYDYTAMK